MAEHDFSKFGSRLRLAGTLQVVTGLRIASGSSSGATGADISVVKDLQGSPYIPGSSFKGVLRSAIERIARSIDKRPALWSCPDPLDDDQRCVSKDHMKDLRDEFKRDEQGLSDKVYEESCTTCSLFGSSWLSSKVLIKDMLLVGNWNQGYPVRDGVGINRDTGTAHEGALYSYEIVPPGIRFECEILVENAANSELALLFLGLREIQSGRIQLGGGRSRGLGWVMLGPWTETEFVDAGDPGSLLSFLDSGKGEPFSEEKINQIVRKQLEIAFSRDQHA
ncbi:CRISPR-associated RAMP protein Csx7 [bacterium]|nr:CRISPR-associated RAMP protein Csx7 [bacterium]